MEKKHGVVGLFCTKGNIDEVNVSSLASIPGIVFDGRVLWWNWTMKMHGMGVQV